MMITLNKAIQEFDEDEINIKDIEYAILHNCIEILDINNKQNSCIFSIEFTAKLTVDYKNKKIFYIKVNTYDNHNPNSYGCNDNDEPYIIYISITFSRSKNTFYKYFDIT